MVTKWTASVHRGNSHDQMTKLMAWRLRNGGGLGVHLNTANLLTSILILNLEKSRYYSLLLFQSQEF